MIFFHSWQWPFLRGKIPGWKIVTFLNGCWLLYLCIRDSRLWWSASWTGVRTMLLDWHQWCKPTTWRISRPRYWCCVTVGTWNKNSLGHTRSLTVTFCHWHVRLWLCCGFLSLRIPAARWFVCAWLLFTQSSFVTCIKSSEVVFFPWKVDGDSLITLQLSRS